MKLHILLFFAIIILMPSCTRNSEVQKPKTADKVDVKEPVKVKKPNEGLIDSLLYQKLTAERPDQILTKYAYVTSYNKETKCPNWVAWHLTADHADGDVQRPNNAFHADEAVPQPRVEWYDYKGSGWSRGHMCPAGDNKWSETAMYESFLMTNIVPQDRGLNSGDWNELELNCRAWAREYGDIYIVCGPLPYAKPWDVIGEREICVPRALFKVVLCLRGKPKAIGFVYKNIPQDNPKSSYVNSVRQVERLTGIDFFPSLPDAIEDAVETEVNLEDWGLE